MADAGEAGIGLQPYNVRMPKQSLIIRDVQQVACAGGTSRLTLKATTEDVAADGVEGGQLQLSVAGAAAADFPIDGIINVTVYDPDAGDEGEDVRAVLQELTKSLTWTHQAWRYYKTLFMAGAERVALLHERTGPVFDTFQRVLGPAIVLEIAQLLADHRVSGQAVVSIRRAIVDLPYPKHDKRRTPLFDELNRLRRQYAPIIEYRNTMAAHNEFAVAIGRKESAKVILETVDHAIADCVKLTNAVFRLFGTSHLFPDDGSVDEQVRILCKLLRKGNDAIDDQGRLRQDAFDAKYGPGYELPDDPLDSEME